MSLATLHLGDLRCLERAELELDPGLNLITGDNGSGKTSLLEAVFMLGRGRSFRTRHTAQLIRHGSERLWIHGRTEPEPGHVLGIECSRADGLHLRLDRAPVDSRVELSRVFPVQIIDPGIHRLVEEGPAGRRRWFDWAMFHVEPDFLRQWQAYTRALRQRNAALQAAASVAPWTAELVRLGEALTEGRARLLDLLQPYWTTVTTRLGVLPATLGFSQGWARESPLAVALETHEARDRERGLTGIGPHRFDILLRCEGRPARDVVSRGQQKLLGIAMAISMAQFLSEHADRASTLLLDDPAAELDAQRTQALLQTVRALDTQLIVTSLEPDDERFGIPNKVFHVEQGSVRSL